jgi:hypothetical protein
MSMVLIHHTSYHPFVGDDWLLLYRKQVFNTPPPPDTTDWALVITFQNLVHCGENSLIFRDAADLKLPVPVVTKYFETDDVTSLFLFIVSE